MNKKTKMFIKTKDLDKKYSRELEEFRQMKVSSFAKYWQDCPRLEFNFKTNYLVRDLSEIIFS